MGCAYTREKSTQLLKAYRKASDTQYLVRELEVDDYYKGFYETLNVFRDIYAQEICSEEQFREILKTIQNSNYTHKVIVVEDRTAALPKQKIVGCGTIIIKPNRHVSMGPLACIEDVSVRRKDDSDTAAKLINCLLYMAVMMHCEKVMVESEEKNRTFYEDYGFIENGITLEYLISPYDVLRCEARERAKRKNSRNRKDSLDIQFKTPTPQHVKFTDTAVVAVQDAEPPQ